MFYLVSTAIEICVFFGYACTIAFDGCPSRPPSFCLCPVSGWHSYSIFVWQLTFVDHLPVLQTVWKVATGMQEAEQLLQADVARARELLRAHRDAQTRQDKTMVSL
jgi:hypothetical protein